jgi:hypothetical protein
MLGAKLVKQTLDNTSGLATRWRFKLPKAEKRTPLRSARFSKGTTNGEFINMRRVAG